MSTTNERTPIILCATEKGRAVLFGYVDSEPVEGEPVKLHRARMVIRWASGGLFRLAAEGPIADDRISPEVPSTTETVWQEWIEVSDEAADMWEDYE